MPKDWITSWVPLRLIVPDADVPVPQLSLQHHLGPAHHLAMGRALAPLEDENVLVLGAGNLTHNTQAIMGAFQSGPDAEPADWATGFDRMVGVSSRLGRFGADFG